MLPSLRENKETINKATVIKTIAPEVPSGYPWVEHSQLAIWPPIAEKRQITKVSQNICLRFLLQFIAVAAGTMSKALISSTPTNRRDKFTTIAKRMINAC